MLIESLVVDLSKDPFNPELNFKVAEEYRSLNQTASAVSFYLRAVEYGAERNNITHRDLAYVSLIRMASCFEDQKDRASTVINSLLQAVALYPSRPDAYFLISRFYESTFKWQESYSWAEIGLWIESSHDPLEHYTGYDGRYCLMFQKAISAYWIGRKDEAFEILVSLSKMEDILDVYKDAIRTNLERNAII